MASHPGEVTRLLQVWCAGDQSALAQLTPLVYNDLRRLADRYMRRERDDHTLQPTALVHEVYLRLLDRGKISWQDRSHFYAVAARLMRRILVDHARAKRTAKRTPPIPARSADSAAVAPERALDLAALDLALTHLETIDSRKSRIIELRFFGGLTISQTADAMGLSTATVIIETRLARAWLRGRIDGGGGYDLGA